MIRTSEMTIVETGMSEQAIQAIMESTNIAFVIDEQGGYVGCYTKVKGINTKSKVITQCREEEQLAKEIFAANKKIHNIPVIDNGGRLLYQYIGEFEDYKFESKEYWESRYCKGGTSGAGSYNRLAKFKAEVVNQFIEKHKIMSIIEWGCGDGNQLGLFLPRKYTGYDVSNTAVELCRKKYVNDANKKFYVYDGSRQQVEEADMGLSLDVIYHLVEDKVFEDYMHNLFMNSAKYVCIYSSDVDNRSAMHVRERKFTQFVREKFSEWELFEYIKNRYPYNPNKPDEEDTSISDFYFYKRVVVE